MYSTAEIGRIVGARSIAGGEREIAHLLYDSRKIQQPGNSLFFAIKTPHNDGHRYIAEAYQKGVRAFVVSEKVILDEAVILEVADTLGALQTLAAHHRSRFHLPVIGITGSNGKTIVKEWLNQLLENDYSIVRSPKSFNSQIGVPLSVWEINAGHTLGIFEAGISHRGEMEKLERIIQPTIGVITNLGEAHSEGFTSREEKLREKLALFRPCKLVVGPKKLLARLDQPTLTWSMDEEADLRISSVRTTGGRTTIRAVHREKAISLDIPFSDEAAVQNAITCLCVLLAMALDPDDFVPRFLNLHPVDMRLQLHHAINNCLLINDSYSADLTSLKIALHFLDQQSSGRSRTVILSDFVETGKAETSLYKEIAQLLKTYGIRKVIAIGGQAGPVLESWLPSVAVQRFSSTEEFVKQFRSSQFAGEIILLKGARRFGFEAIAALFEQKLHGTVLQINLTALAHNLRAYQEILQPSTRIMAMVKAFSYGSGGAEIASVLQFHNTAFLGVAYADEGIELVKAGITLPIMVMNPEPASYGAIVEHSLQPVLYSLPLLRDFEEFVKTQGLTQYPVHIEVETGMNRLGFPPDKIGEVAGYLAASSTLRMQSLFSHLAASEEAGQDAFTQQQASRFREAAAVMEKTLSYPFLRHIANSAAIVRHPHLQMDMVRLGIGLYGIEPDAEAKLSLEPVATLRSTIAQIKEVEAGESVSYNRKGVVHRRSLIATVRIGYADGYSRRFSNGSGKMWVRGRLAPVIGTICMDMTMLDVTDIEGVKEGDDVILFGKELPVQDVAAWAGTIPYEIMTAVSQRVKRVYYYE
ncbi:bifunctional UDP-N-acetylmuramoyl-tripeptide:D-alanyl-D-alanine ligase/alanine racemase [Flavisolibacter nicotianae]|uniref:bifunctional UDP-N-acetylmuramoyl-tripeptide:D-alanyl-D-alanine ligase/alanine racemase n=1 Tax=Flavisolibacter nicotianae TaxID=2364882 RepID=UPI0013C42957|nr:bifunctional UDP-N-acetylmuramoyl-tripeptide:D-alanyl-D-alanine ligase/alanine racemase [Flavisolibacter nicotianae]